MVGSQVTGEIRMCKKKLMAPRDSEVKEQLQSTNKPAVSSKEREGSGKDENGSVPEANELPRSSLEEDEPQASLDLYPGGV